MRNRRVSSGFTLIELVSVIMVLGVLSATIAPRFINISSEARARVLDSIAGSMRSISSLVNMKVIIEDAPDKGYPGKTIMTDLGSIDYWNKYPAAKGAIGKYGIAELISLDSDDITIFVEDQSNPDCWSIKIGYDESTCYVQYKEACSFSVLPEISLDNSGC